MTEQERLEKNKRISESKRSTIERHSNMLCKTFDVKIQWNQCSKIQKEALERVFLEQKWLKKLHSKLVRKSRKQKSTSLISSKKQSPKRMPKWKMKK